MHYQVIESKLNQMSLEELEMHDPNTFGVIINKLLHLSSNSNKGQESAVNVLAYSIANLETKGKTKHTNSKNIYYDRSRDSWCCGISFEGKYRKIKTSRSKEVVLKAYEEFCAEHNIKL